MKQESMKRYCPGFQNPATLVVERFKNFGNHCEGHSGWPGRPSQVVNKRVSGTFFGPCHLSPSPAGKLNRIID